MVFNGRLWTSCRGDAVIAGETLAEWLTIISLAQKPCERK